MFRNTMGKGFQLTFANGNTISVQWGKGNYCENHFKDIAMEGVNLWGYSLDSKDAEVAVWDKDGNWTTKDFIPDLSDDVAGGLSADEVLALMVKVAK